MIYTLHKQGHSIRSIARITGLNRRTISRRLRFAEYNGYKQRDYNSKLDPYKDYIKKRFYDTLPHLIPSSVIFKEIEKLGYNGKIRIIQTFLSKLKQDKNQMHIEPEVRFETPKGYQAQVDWTIIRSGKNPIYAFVMVLGYSRYSFVYFTDNMRQDTWQDCHLKAFNYFNGVPQTILYDNLKSVVIERDYYGNGKHKFNSEFLDFCKGIFIPKICKPFRAKTKGKVERFNLYLKNNFYYPLKSSLIGSGLEISVALLNSHIFSWLEFANDRLHDTLKAKPSELFKLEQGYLSKVYKSMEPVSKDICVDISPKRVANVNIPNLDIVYHTKISDYERLLTGGVR